jgi:dihydrofolate reductase
MPSTQYYAAASLDGFIATEDDSLDWLTGYQGHYEGDDVEPGKGAYDEFYEGVGATVMGSNTYEWILREIRDQPSGRPVLEDWPYAGKPSWVLSSRQLEMPPGDSDANDVRVRNASVADLHEEMIASAGDRNLWVVGGGPVASQFADRGLLDELHVTVVPVVLGTGRPLFERPLAKTMQLAGTRTFDSGMVELRYELRA